MNQFNTNFINKFLQEILPVEYPELLTGSTFKIQSTIINFINYISLKGILDYKVQKEIFQNFGDLTEEKRDFKASLIDKEIINIRDKIIDYSQKLDEIYNDNRRLKNI